MRDPLPSPTGVGEAPGGGRGKDPVNHTRQSRSRALLPAVTLALNTGMRRGEIQSLTWGQIDLENKRLTVGHSKTDAGRGRAVPLNASALEDAPDWRPDRRTAALRLRPRNVYGPSQATIGRTLCKADESDGGAQIKSLKEAWEWAKDAAEEVRCRFHDLRHTVCTPDGGTWRAAARYRLLARLEHRHHCPNGATVQAHRTAGPGRRGVCTGTASDVASRADEPSKRRAPAKERPLEHHGSV